jgi:hypothetical protein
MNKITEIFNTENETLYVSFKGTINADDLISHIDRVGQNDSNPRFLKVLADGREATFDLSAKDLQRINKQKAKYRDYYNYLAYAALLNNPITVALSVIYHMISRTDKHSFQCFSTEDAAKRWLYQKSKLRKVS